MGEFVVSRKVDYHDWLLGEVGWRSTSTYLISYTRNYTVLGSMYLLYIKHQKRSLFSISSL